MAASLLSLISCASGSVSAPQDIGTPQTLTRRFAAKPRVVRSSLLVNGGNILKYPIILIALASVVLLMGLGIRMHADWRYTNKMYYHTIESTLYEFDEVFAERKLGDALQFWSIVAGVAAGSWFVFLKIRK